MQRALGVDDGHRDDQVEEHEREALAEDQRAQRRLPADVAQARAQPPIRGRSGAREAPGTPYPEPAATSGTTRSPGARQINTAATKNEAPSIASAVDAPSSETAMPASTGPPIIAAASATLNAALPSGIRSWGTSVDAVAERVIVRAGERQRRVDEREHDDRRDPDSMNHPREQREQAAFDHVQPRQDPPRRHPVDPRDEPRPDQPRQELRGEEQRGGRQRRPGRGEHDHGQRQRADTSPARLIV